MEFEAYGRPLEIVKEFKYLGRILMALDKSWLLVDANLKKVHNRWAHLSRIIGREGVDP